MRTTTQSVVNLDPISSTRKKQDSVISRIFKTRQFGGKPMKKTAEFGHYLFVGKQRHGKTISAIWYLDRLYKRYTKKGYNVQVFSNIGLKGSINVSRATFFDLLNKIEYDKKTIYIFLIDEIQAWFPKDSKNKITLELIDRLTGEFSQLGKRQIYVLSTAQVYGRLNKNLREQCLYMIHCRPSTFFYRCVNDFISGDDVMCDDLGRWSGIPKKIYVHGISKISFDTHRRVTI